MNLQSTIPDILRQVPETDGNKFSHIAGWWAFGSADRAFVESVFEHCRRRGLEVVYLPNPDGLRFTCLACGCTRSAIEMICRFERLKIEYRKEFSASGHSVSRETRARRSGNLTLSSDNSGPEEIPTRPRWTA
jgi:hypothetical protein